MFLLNPKRDAIRTRGCSFDVAKTFPNKPLRNFRYFNFAPDNHIYWCNVIQVSTELQKIITHYTIAKTRTVTLNFLDYLNNNNSSF